MHILSSQEHSLASIAEIEFAQLAAFESAGDREFEFLLACCSETTATSPHKHVSSSLDWVRILRLAKHHRVLPALANALQRATGIPASTQSDLRGHSNAHARQILRLCAELAAILRKFSNCGIEVLPQKGPVLGQVLFGNPAMRQFGDLDLLVRKQDVPRVRKALQELGYQPKLRLSTRQERAYLHSGYEYAFWSDAGANLVELQWQILPRFYSISFDTDSLFARAVEIDFEGTRTSVLRNEDLMLVLCVHAAKHEWSQLGMVRDIATLSKFDLDWDRIQREARRLGILRILAISLLLARDLLGCRLSRNFESSEDFDVSRKLARVFQSGLKALHENDTQSVAYFRTMMRIRERWQDRARLAWRLAVTPDVGEWENFVIPDALFPLYRAVRAFRLVRRFSYTAGERRKAHLARAI